MMMMGKQQKRKNTEENYDYNESDFPSDNLANVHTMMFPLILSALANVHTHFARTILKKYLQKLHRSLESITLQNNDALLSLFPSLLRTTKYLSIACRSAEIVGSAALLSFEANERIASDAEIIKALLSALSSRSKRLSMAACNAVLDLSSTSFGRLRLCEFPSVEKLMSVFLQDTTSFAKYVSLCNMGKEIDYCHGVGIIEDELPFVVLDTTVTLINACNMKQLAEIPRKLYEHFLSYLKLLWVQVQDQHLQKNIAECKKERNCSFIKVRSHELAESIFRLSINLDHRAITCTSEMVKRHIFGPNQSEFEHFMFSYWEDSPLLLSSLSNPLKAHDDIFSSFVQSFNFKRTLNAILSSILGGIISCPPLPSDELDILNFLKQLKDRLGYPIVYGQDIRVVKTVEVIHEPNQGNLKREVHFLTKCRESTGINSPDFINIGNVKKCEEAHQDGYTIALRGMEFRSENIAAIADGFAVLFGQPSVGANAYLTPPRSQGLARHYDDHCVFVCQLIGQKQWTVFPRPTLYLPRLYEEPLDNLLGLESESVVSDCKQFLLREGDILYIPRGCPHEACTTADDGSPETHDASTEFSLHMTLGIEVEPPFEWEGFAHVALHCWNKKPPQFTPVDSFMGILNVMSIYLLHVSIQLIGDHDPTFRKACMVVAFSLPSVTKDKQQNDALDLNQRTTFSYVIKRIDKEARFSEVFKCVEVAIQEKNENLFQRMRWLRHLCPEGDTEEDPDWNILSTEFKNSLPLCKDHIEDAEAEFMQVKSRFCQEVVFENVCENFEKLLHKYKRSRTRYMNGMLSLHCT